MSEPRDVLDRLAPLFPAPDHALERCLRLRDRRRRNRRIGAATLALVITAVMIASFVVSFRGSQRQPVTDPRPINPSNVHTLRLAWSGKTSPDPWDRRGVGGSEGMTVSDGMLYAVSTGDGKLWAFPTDCGSDGAPCRPKWSGAFDVRPGRCDPNRCIGDMPSGPAVEDGMVFVGGLNHVYAFPVSCRRSPCPPAWVGRTREISNQPVAADGVVYAGSLDGFLYAFPTRCEHRCEPLWTSARQTNPLEVSQVDDGTVYVGTNGVYFGGEDLGTAYGFPVDCKDGCEPRWTAPMPDSIFATPPVAADGVVYVARSTANRQRNWDFYQPSIVSAYDASCGLEAGCALWSASMPGFVSRSPIVAEGVLVVMSRRAGLIRAYPTSCDGTCEPLWSAAVPAGPDRAFDPPLVVADGLVLVGSRSSGVSAFSLHCGTDGATCEPSWTSDQPAYEVAVAEGKVFARSDDGTLYAFSPDEGPATVGESGGISGSGSDGRALVFVSIVLGGIVLIVGARWRRS